jgi:hypothetical protein
MRAATSIPPMYADQRGLLASVRSQDPVHRVHRRQSCTGPSRKERAQDDKVVVR